MDQRSWATPGGMNKEGWQPRKPERIVDLGEGEGCHKGSIDTISRGKWGGIFGEVKASLDKLKLWMSSTESAYLVMVV